MATSNGDGDGDGGQAGDGARPGVGPAFEGVRVLELDQGLAGAYCGHLLGLLGADVIKVESPARPARVRTVGPFVDDRPDPETSGTHVHLDARKRSLALDVATPSGGALLDRLAARADVLIDDGVLGAPPAVRARYDALLGANPHLVLVALSPFGLDGPKASHRSSELCALASSGWLTQNGNHPERAPIMPGSSCAELGVGTLAALGAALALRARRTRATGTAGTGTGTGTGQLVDVSRQEAMLSLLAFPTALFAWLGVDSMRMGDGYPFAIVACADGHLGVSILTQRHWEALCRFMGRPELLERADLADSAARAEPAAIEAIMGELTRFFADKAAQPTFEAAQAMRVPIAIIPSPAQVLGSAQYDARGYWLQAKDPRLGRLRLPGPPYQASAGTFAAYRPAPERGEHSGEVLDELGVAAADRVALAALGALG